MPFVIMLHTMCKKIIGMCGWYECELVTQLIEFEIFIEFPMTKIQKIYIYFKIILVEL